MRRGYGDRTEETIHKSVRVRMKVVLNWSGSALTGWTWNEGGFWGKGSNRIVQAWGRSWLERLWLRTCSERICRSFLNLSILQAVCLLEP